MPRTAGLVAAAILFAAAPLLQARLQVDIALKRTLYIAYEPIIVNLSISNLTGDTLQLGNSAGSSWLGFVVETLDGRPVPPRAPYRHAPFTLGPGEKIVRSVNIAPLFPLAEYGGYRIRAGVDAQPFGTFSSAPLNIEVTEGRTVWSKTVGVPPGEPGGGGSRDIALLTHRFPSSSQLYIRISDPGSRSVLCTHRLGRIVSYGVPDVQLDHRNRIHILQNLAPKTFLYSLAGLDGRISERKTYVQRGKRPALVVAPDGTASVSEATEMALDGNLQPSAPGAQPLPSLSDRPVEIPSSSRGE